MSRFETYMEGTLLELRNGFHFASAPPADVTSERYLDSANAWDVLACVLARCQVGDFGAVDRLPALLRRDDGAVVWSACCQLLGFTGSRRLLEAVVDEYAGEFGTRGVQHYVSVLLVNSCGLWVVPHLLAMHALAMDEDARVCLEQRLSLLLESSSGPVWGGPEKSTVVDNPDLPPVFQETSTRIDLEGYRTLVHERLAELRSARRSQEEPAYAQGETFDIERLARTLLHRINNTDYLYRIEWERMVFEATTGISCRSFFDADSRVQPQAAAAVIESFLDSGEATRFTPGVRYFFGHRVPE